MDPIKVALSVASTAASAATAVAQGRQQEAVFDYNAKINRRNAEVADVAAEQLYQTERLKIQKFQKEFKKLQSATKQGFRYNGWIADGDTPMLGCFGKRTRSGRRNSNPRLQRENWTTRVKRRRCSTTYGSRTEQLCMATRHEWRVLPGRDNLLSGASDMYQIYKG